MPRDGSDTSLSNQTVAREGGTGGELPSPRVKLQAISNICERDVSHDQERVSRRHLEGLTQNPKVRLVTSKHWLFQSFDPSTHSFTFLFSGWNHGDSLALGISCLLVTCRAHTCPNFRVVRMKSKPAL